MLKTSALALATIAMIGVSAPAYAGGLMISNDQKIHGYSESALISRLEARGITATDVESWGQLVRVNVVLDDGTNAVQMYDPDSLKLIYG